MEHSVLRSFPLQSPHGNHELQSEPHSIIYKYSSFFCYLFSSRAAGKRSNLSCEISSVSPVKRPWKTSQQEVVVNRKPTDACRRSELQVLLSQRGETLLDAAVRNLCQHRWVPPGVLVFVHQDWKHTEEPGPLEGLGWRDILTPQDKKNCFNDDFLCFGSFTP